MEQRRNQSHARKLPPPQSVREAALYRRDRACYVLRTREKAVIAEPVPALLRIPQLRPVRLRRSLHHLNRRLQQKVQHRLRRQLDLLALRCRLRRTSRARARRRPNRRSLAATRDRTNNPAQNRASANLLRRVLASRLSFFPVLVGL